VTLVRPKRLRAGDRVALVSPAGPTPPELLDQGVAVLRSWGLDVEVAPHARDLHPALPYLAGTDADRAQDLHDAWCDPEVRAVVCVRGGYGCLRMLDHVDWSSLATAEPTVFAGSSDVTALHAEFAARLGVATLFSPMAGTNAFVADPAAQEHLRRTLFEPENVRTLTRPSAVTVVPGKARGITVGGNASLVVSALGARHEPPPPDGAIVLLEDISEEPYRLDRILTQLLRSGWFDGVAGIALGSWVGCGRPEETQAVLADLLGGLGVPVVGELGFGHCPEQLTMPLGVEVELDADARTLTVLEPALT
jgi:muramoyltetrapeptide carboxypeptidase